MFPSNCLVNFEQTFKMLQRRKCKLVVFPSTGLKLINQEDVLCPPVDTRESNPDVETRFFHCALL